MELKALLENTGVEILSMDDFPDIPEIEEDGASFFENALKKAMVVSEYTGEIVLADDSGLEVECLGGEPGIYSSRYAGPAATDEENNRKLLKKLERVPKEKRNAAFHCVLVLFFPEGRHELFEGIWSGKIGFEPAGDMGFGYDPLFIDPEYNLTAAQLPPEIKNSISHRGRAISKLKKRLTH